MRRVLAIALAICAGVLAPLVVGGPANAAPPIGSWADMTITPPDPAVQNHSGTISFGIAGFPDATYTVTKPSDDGRGVELVDNLDEYIPADTPFGAVFGASGPSATNKFLKTRADTSATITVTFAYPAPANMLGFAVNDIDADKVTLGGTRGDSTPLTGADLNGSAFNICDSNDPSPDCSGASAPFALPTWDPVSMVVDSDGIDSEGAAAWFRPSVAVSTLTLLYESKALSGAPSFRLWFATLGSSATGTVSFVDGATSTPVTVELVDADGTVVDTTTTAADGTYTLGPALPAAGYAVRLTVPAGATLRGTNPVTVDLSGGSATADFVLAGAVAPNFTG